jgi:hypothetical protein
MPIVVSPRAKRTPSGSKKPAEWLSLVFGVLVLAAILYFTQRPDRGNRRYSAPAPLSAIQGGPPAAQNDSLAQAGYTVKGNISVNTGEKLYHVPGMRDYDITIIDPSRG